MARLSNATFILQRMRLRKEWSSDTGGVFVMLSPTDQWALHDFYACTKSLNIDESLAHRAAVTKAQPSLPQRAGKAFKKIEVFLNLPPRVPTPAPLHADGRRRKVRNSKRIISVRSVVRPDIDTKLLARALLQHVREQEKRKRDEVS